MYLIRWGGSEMYLIRWGGSEMYLIRWGGSEVYLIRWGGHNYDHPTMHGVSVKSEPHLQPYTI